MIRDKSALKKSLSAILTVIMLLGIITPSNRAGSVAADADLIESSVVTEKEPAVSVDCEETIITQPREDIDSDAEEPASVTYSNSISGMLWLDMYDDTENGIYAGDGTRQAEEAPLGGYTVYLYAEGDMSAAVRTTVSDANGNYGFANISPGTYVVGVSTVTMDGVEYLLPFWYLTGTEGDNRFVTSYDPEADAYLYAYTAPIELTGDTAAADMDAGMRTVPQIAPLATGTFVYHGRLLDSNRNPLSYAKFEMAILYMSDFFWQTLDYDISTVTTDSSGYFSCSFNGIEVYTPATGGGMVYITLVFPSSNFSSDLTVLAGETNINKVRGWNDPSLYKGSLSRFTLAPSYGISSLYAYVYRVADYQVAVSETVVTLYIGSGALGPQNIEINAASYTVTEKFVDAFTESSLRNDNTLAVLTASPRYTSAVTRSDIVTPTARYIYKGYKMGSYSAGDTLDGTGIPTAVTLASNQNVYFVYQKVVDTTINVTFPTRCDFYVDRSTYPNVETGASGDDITPYYKFENKSDLPVYVDLDKMAVTNADGQTFVSSAPSINNEIQLNIEPTDASVLNGTANGFTGNVTGVTSMSYTEGTARLGSLDGTYITQITPTSADGYVTLGGSYQGILTGKIKTPVILLTFKFTIIN